MPLKYKRRRDRIFAGFVWEKCKEKILHFLAHAGTPGLYFPQLFNFFFESHIHQWKKISLSAASKPQAPQMLWIY